MKLEQSFEVSAPIDRVWKALIDVEHVAPCLPGAAVTGRNDDGTYNGTFSIKIGPTTAAYAGKLEMKEIDEEAHEATMHAQGNDKRGQGGANATIVSKVVEEQPGETRVDVATDYHITGRLARFGRGGMIEDISERLLREFAQRLQASLADEPAAQDKPPEAPAPPPAEEAAPPPTDVAAPPSADAAAPPAAEAAPPPAEEAATLAPQTEEAQAEEAQAEPPAAEPQAEPAGPASIAKTEDAAEAIEPEPEPLSPDAAPEPAVSEPAASQPAPSQPPPPQENEPLDAGSLVGSVMAERVRRNPGPLVLLLGLLVALIALRRKHD